MTSHPIAVSLKARGLSVLEKSFVVAFKEFWPQAGAETLDLGISIAINVVLLTWSTWFSVILTILSLCFYAFFKDGQVATDGSLIIPVAFLIYLPTTWLAVMANARRLEGARHLEQDCGAPQLLSGLDDAISDTVGQLQSYLSHPRPLSNLHFSPSCLQAGHLTVKSRLFMLSRDIGLRLRRLHSSQRHLSEIVSALLQHCSSSQQQHSVQLALSLSQHMVKLHRAVAALTTIKDLRSPLLLRAMLRAGCVLLAPLITGSWLARLAYQATPPGKVAGAVGMVFAIVVGSIIQVLLMSLLTMGLMLEDPFDTAGAMAAPDTISLMEFNHVLSYLTAPPVSSDVPQREQPDPNRQHQHEDGRIQKQPACVVSAEQQQLHQEPQPQQPDHERRVEQPIQGLHKQYEQQEALGSGDVQVIVSPDATSTGASGATRV